jgi:hypothetical protein
LSYEKEIEAVKDKLRWNAGGVDGELEYSDYEEDISLTKDRRSGNSFAVDGERWSPAFLGRHQSQSSRKPPLRQPLAQIVPGGVPVRATPSLIKAMDRIAMAQNDAFGIAAGVSATDAKRVSRLTEESEPGMGIATNQTRRAPRWEEFWREVRVKAHS